MLFEMPYFLLKAGDANLSFDRFDLTRKILPQNLRAVSVIVFNS